MDVVLGILGLAAFVLVIMLLQKLLGRGAAAVTGAITGNTRKRGLAAVRDGIHFSAPVPPQDIIDRVVSTLELPRAPRAVGGDIYLDQLAADHSAAVIKAGNRIKDFVVYGIQIDATDAGCSGEAGVLSWLESDGTIVATDQIERISRHVRSAVQTYGGSVA